MVTRKSLLVSLLSAAVVFSTAAFPLPAGAAPAGGHVSGLGAARALATRLRCHGAEPGFRGYPPAGDV